MLVDSVGYRAREEWRTHRTVLGGDATDLSRTSMETSELAWRYGRTYVRTYDEMQDSTERNASSTDVPQLRISIDRAERTLSFFNQRKRRHGKQEELPIL